MTHPQYAVQQQHRASVVFGLGLSSLIINVVGCCAFVLIPYVLTVLAAVLGIIPLDFGRHDLRAMHARLMDSSGVLDYKSGKNSCHGVARLLILVQFAFWILMVVLGLFAAIGVVGAAGP